MLQWHAFKAHPFHKQTYLLWSGMSALEWHVCFGVECLLCFIHSTKRDACLGMLACMTEMHHVQEKQWQCFLGMHVALMSSTERHCCLGMLRRTPGLRKTNLLTHKTNHKRKTSMITQHFPYLEQIFRMCYCCTQLFSQTHRFGQRIQFNERSSSYSRTQLCSSPSYVVSIEDGKSTSPCRIKEMEEGSVIRQIPIPVVIWCDGNTWNLRMSVQIALATFRWLDINWKLGTSG